MSSLEAVQAQAAAELERRRRLAQRRRSLTFREFVDQAYPRYVWYRHCDELGAVLQRVADDELKRVMIFMPPRGGKSLLTSKLFPAYYLYKHPERWMGIASYAAELAYTFSRASRDAYRAIGGALRGDAQAVKNWETPEGGGLWAAGVGGPATGKGFFCGLIDDPLKNAEEAGSEAIREKQKEWYASTFYTRSEPDGAIVVIQTRWHEDDLSGWLLREEKEEDEPERWHIVNFEAIKEEVLPQFPATCTVQPDWRLAGDALCPERFDLPKLERIKKRLGAYYFSALYQQRPVPLTGGIVKSSWINRYRIPPQGAVFISLDTANKAKELSDYSVFTVWTQTDTGYYLLDVVRERLEYPDLKHSTKTLAQKWKPSAILIEDKGSGQSLIQELKREGAWNCIAIEPEGDKVTRMATEAAAFESGRVWLPENAPWLSDFELELLRFPGAPNDDQVDSTSQFLRWVRNNFYQNWGTTEGIWGYG